MDLLPRLLRKLICLVPLQIARAENESFVILKDGMREDVSDFSNLSELAEFISFGLYELVLESNENPVVVISSMGKQSTGKSYMLNHLAGQLTHAFKKPMKARNQGCFVLRHISDHACQ